MKLTLYKPKLEDLWFRKKMLEDEETMSYNHAWGGTVPFPVDDWEDWYDYWITNNDSLRFYRYLLNDKNEFVGEIAYHYDRERKIYVANVIIYAKYRKRGYGKEGLMLLIENCKNNNIDILWDDLALGNEAGLRLFLKCGFTKEYETSDYIMLKKELNK